MTNYSRHIPVMLSEVIENLNIKDTGIYVDATFGNGGYTEAILKTKNCKVIAIDRDPSVISRANELKEVYGNRFDFRAGSFGDLDKVVSEKVDGVVFDIGVSSMQLDDGYRGFSFSKEAPLDMRMSMSGVSAKDIVNNLPEDELADLIYSYGEEKKSRQIAKKIALYREQKEITTTTELAEIIYSVIHKKFGQIDPATRTFQAIRIAVNDELNQLKDGLLAGHSILKEEGRIVVVDFHSLEDKIVKNFFNSNAPKRTHTSKYKTDNNAQINTDGLLFSFASKSILPTEDECNLNPRARSAKLRYAIKKKG
ncbi:MAG: 16S rRNA (cytosine(1402)-N(4))-methyltransferase RsmH [Alphaproteobacteria bacterium]|nr:16S rRNA (cytosine(1402)-N(4))-methyltransferase RsmH [Alphaproteobacteria bacterium]